MSDKILPATDAEIAEAREDFFGDDKRYLGVHSGLLYSLFARIEADREASRAKDALIAELVSALEGLTDSAVTDSDACSICLHGVPIHIAGCAKVQALAILAKAKEAGQ